MKVSLEDEVEWETNIDKRESSKHSKVSQAIDNLSKESPFFSNNPAKNHPIFQRDEIITGEILGSGQFGVIRDIKQFRDHVTGASPFSNDYKQNGIECTGENNSCKKMDISYNAVDNNKLPSVEVDFICGSEGNQRFMKDNCKRGGSIRYVVKSLQDCLSPECEIRAMIDLAIEAKFLAVLSHPNIIKMSGVGHIPGHPDYFMILERIDCTLEDKRNLWREEMKQSKKRLSIRSGKEQKSLSEELHRVSLTVICEVANAMKYLHKHNIIHRDLKTANVGIDIRGNAKIFDFGAAKELLSKNMVQPGMYRATGLTGTRRYMSPEVLLCKNYGLSTDVFSFSLLLWEILALKIPFDQYDCEKHMIAVVQRRKMPKFASKWSSVIKDLITNCWKVDPLERPSFCSIVETIESERKIHAN